MSDHDRNKPKIKPKMLLCFAGIILVWMAVFPSIRGCAQRQALREAGGNWNNIANLSRNPHHRALVSSPIITMPAQAPVAPPPEIKQTAVSIPEIPPPAVPPATAAAPVIAPVTVSSNVVESAPEKVLTPEDARPEQLIIGPGESYKITKPDTVVMHWHYSTNYKVSITCEGIPVLDWKAWHPDRLAREVVFKSHETSKKVLIELSWRNKE